MWICYFHALQKGDINKVVPIDKSSTILTILMALIFLHEGLSWEKAVFASLTAILGKLAFPVWIPTLIEKKELLFIGLSGIATGASFFLGENS